MQEVQHRKAPDQRIGSAQRLDRDEGTAIGRAELYHAGDAFCAILRKRRARKQATHAVADQHDVPAAFADQAFSQRAAVCREIEAPVIGMEYRVEARDAQDQAQPLIGETQDAQWPVAATARQGEPGQAAQRYFRQGRTT